MSNRDSQSFDAELAAMDNGEFVERITSAYRNGDRERFILLSQRLVRDVVTQTIRSVRLRSHRDDLQSVGMIELIRHFDRGPVAAVERPFGFCRRLVYFKLLQWCYSQRILRRKGAKHASIILDADVSARTDDGWSFIETATADATDRMRATTPCKPRAAKCRQKRREKRSPMAFDASVTATPKELRAKGMTWQAIGELLGISLAVAYSAAHSTTQRTPRELRRQAAASRDARARVKAGRKVALAVA